MTETAWGPWVEWSGEGSHPHNNMTVCVQLRRGDVITESASALRWHTWGHDPGDIVRFRVAQPEPYEPKVGDWVAVRALITNATPDTDGEIRIQYGFWKERVHASCILPSAIIGPADPPAPVKTPGQVAMEAWDDHNYRPRRKYEDIGADLQRGWEAVAKAVLEVGR